MIEKGNISDQKLQMCVGRVIEILSSRGLDSVPLSLRTLSFTGKALADNTVKYIKLVEKLMSWIYSMRMLSLRGLLWI